MRIIFINRFFYPDHSATSQMLTDLAFYLSSQNIPVEVIASRQRYDDPGANLSKNSLEEGVRVHRVFSTCFVRDNLLGRFFDSISFFLGVLIF